MQASLINIIPSWSKSQSLFKARVLSRVQSSCRQGGSVPWDPERTAAGFPSAFGLPSDAPHPAQAPRRPASLTGWAGDRFPGQAEPPPPPLTASGRAPPPAFPAPGGSPRGLRRQRGPARLPPPEKPLTAVKALSTRPGGGQRGLRRREEQRRQAARRRGLTRLRRGLTRLRRPLPGGRARQKARGARPLRNSRRPEHDGSERGRKARTWTGAGGGVRGRGLYPRERGGAGGGEASGWLAAG